MMVIYADLSILPTRGPCSKYHINIPEGEFKGKIEIKFEGDPFKVGVATNLCMQIVMVWFACCRV